MDITSFISTDSIAVGLEVKSKDELIETLLTLADKSGKITNLEEARTAVLEREKLLSTGIGDGIAIPHAKTQAVSDTICSVAILKHPIDFDAVDGALVDVAFLLLGRENNVGAHLRLLSRISRFLCDEEKIAKLRQSKTKEELLNFLDSEE